MYNFDEMLSICYNLNQRTDKKLLPVVLPCFLVNNEPKECFSRMQKFSERIDKLDAVVVMIEQLESEYIFLYAVEFMYVDDELRVKIRYSE